MAMTSSEKQLYDLFLDKSFIIPLNQRKYVWNKDNWEELWDDINLVFDKKVDKHFIGSIVLKEEKADKDLKYKYSIIDGQQRILTIAILLSAIGEIYLENGKFAEYDGLKKHLMVNDTKNNYYPIISGEANTTVYGIINNLYTNKKDFPLIYILDSKKKKQEEKCFVFYYEKLKSNHRRITKYLEIIKNICFIEIIATKQEDAYSIFEALNARGQELGDYDLLRNYLLKQIKNKRFASETLEEIENRLGENVEIFLKHYVKHKFFINNSDKKNRPYKTIISKQKNEGFEELLKDLNLKSIYYKRIIDPQIETNQYEYKIFKYFKAYRQQQFRPLIMGLMHQLELKTITEDEYCNCINYLYKFFTCYHIIGEEKSNKIDDIVDKYSYKFENDFVLSTISEFYCSISKRMIDKQSFKRKLESIQYSNHFKAHSGSAISKKVKAILQLYEETLGFSENLDDLSFNIEHVQPDYESINNSFIGNLLLLEKSINDRIKDKSIEQKISFYKESIFVSPKSVAKKIEYSNFSINERTDEIINKLYDEIKV